ncbi:hypothetical protein JTB14_001913 [Gonioctena quinquepunctata]|nr:hypothetical protein JTB14_001913 [Gonioctena quinquepunctata]
MDKLKKFQTFRKTCLCDISVIHSLADRAKIDKTVRTLFKVRCVELENIKEEFLKQHNNVVSALLAEATADFDAENTIREGFLDNYTIAYDALVKRYSNSRLRAQALWSELDNAPKVNSDNVSNLRKLLDNYSENLAALKQMKFPTDSWDFLLLMMLLKRLDHGIVTRFELEHGSSSIPKYIDLTDFLEKHCLALDTIDVSPSFGQVKRNNYNINSAGHDEFKDGTSPTCQKDFKIPSMSTVSEDWIKKEDTDGVDMSIFPITIYPNTVFRASGSFELTEILPFKRIFENTSAPSNKSILPGRSKLRSAK